jgi:hypothetical protein
MTVELELASFTSSVLTREDYELEASSSPASTCSTSAARTVSSIDASRTKPACKRSSCASDMASRSTPGVASRGRTLCSQRSRISAARGSETARSRKPSSICESEGGSRFPRVARLSRLNRAASRASSFVHLCGPALIRSASASGPASASLSSVVGRLLVTHKRLAVAVPK